MFADRLTKSFARFLRIEAFAGAVLLLCTIAAIVISNSQWAVLFEHAREISAGLQIGSLDFTRSLRQWVNDGLMTLFIFLVALELKRALVLGKLSNPRTAALSIAAAWGGMLVSTVLYQTLQRGTNLPTSKSTPRLPLALPFGSFPMTLTHGLLLAFGG